MKKICLIIFSGFLCAGLAGQNSFPASGNVLIGTSTPLGPLTVGSGNSAITLSNSNDISTGAWIRTDNANTVFSTNVGSLFLGYGGNYGKTIHIGNINPGVAQIAGNAPVGTFVVNTAGNTGIGASNPVSKLDVIDQAAYPAITLSARKNLTTKSIIGSFINGNTEGLYIFHQGTDGISYGAPVNSVILAADYTGGGAYRPLVFATNNISRLTIGTDGNIGIGTIAPGPYKLAVEGMIGARKVKVTQVSPWADYVFEEYYRLPTLQEVEQFIQRNKHLPDVPSAKEVETNGLDLGENQAVLLKKIEELMLYMIEQNKITKQLQSESEQLKKEIELIKASIKK